LGAPIGQQPVVKTSGKRKGYKVFGFIDYVNGRFFHKALDGKLNSESYREFFEEILNQTSGHIVLIQDGASYHRSKAINEFFKKHQQRVTVYQLPSYFPDYNPIEFLRRKIKRVGIHLNYFPAFEDFKKRVDQLLLEMEGKSNEIKGLFGLYTATKDQTA